MTTHPLELTYHWQVPVVVSSVALVVGVALLLRGEIVGRWSAAVVLVLKVSQVLTRRGSSYTLTVRGDDGRPVRRGAPTALLRRGHSTLFDWILTWAPQAELDAGSRRTLQTLRDRAPCHSPMTSPPSTPATTRASDPKRIDRD